MDLNNANEEQKNHTHAQTQTRRDIFTFCLMPISFKCSWGSFFISKNKICMILLAAAFIMHYTKMLAKISLCISSSMRNSVSSVEVIRGIQLLRLEISIKSTMEILARFSYFISSACGIATSEIGFTYTDSNVWCIQLLGLFVGLDLTQFCHDKHFYLNKCQPLSYHFTLRYVALLYSHSFESTTINKTSMSIWTSHMSLRSLYSVLLFLPVL